MKKDFCHLHLHTPFSLLDGFTRLDELFDKCLESGMDSVAITDHGVMFGVVDFYKEALKKGIKPVIGCEVYVSFRDHLDKEAIDKRSYHLVLLAENNKGYQNLIKIVSKGYVDGFYYKPRVDHSILREHSDGLIALSACLAGEVQRMLADGDFEEAKRTALELDEIFGRDNFYLEMQDHGIPLQKKVNLLLKRLSKETGIPLVVTNDVHYTNREDSKAHEILLCVQMGNTLADEHRMEFATDQFYLKTPEEMAELFPDESEALRNTKKIADRCHVSFDFNQIHLPKYDVPDGTDTAEYFYAMVRQGFTKRYENPTKEMKDRLEYELSVIQQMGYADYFLIVWDFIRFAREQNIMVGPGRGSGAGSIVAYSLEITDVDPMRYGLIFERFLNPERISMPDFDVDFCYEKRELVIDYVKEKYHADHVAQIITFGTFGARAAIRDVGRVMGISYADVDKIAKEVPFALGMTIEKALDMNKTFRRMYDEDETAHELIEVSRKIEGLPRHASTHAAGVVIAKKAVDEYVPLYRNQDSITTQFPMNTLEELGLLKMDFLGLRTLTVIQDAIINIEREHGILPDFKGGTYEDKAVYDLISRADTLGVFQLESSGMRSFMKELEPDTFEDIIAGISLYRPGPMDSIPQYVRNKKRADQITYLHPALEPILGVSRGILVYQEQVMEIVRRLAGFSYGRADVLRKAMSKKKMDVMEEGRQYFVHGKKTEDGSLEIAGCVRNGIDEETANKIYDDMIDFAKYAFNKSHAACYAVLSYETAYLKAHYPAEFMAALMTSVTGVETKVVEYIAECSELEIPVLPPDINHSKSYFKVQGGEIRFSLSSVKNVGIKLIRGIEKEVEENGEFESFHDFVSRCYPLEMNKRAIESLVKAGAFDALYPNRASLMAGFPSIMDSFALEKRNNIAGQMSLFEAAAEEIGFDGAQYEDLPAISDYRKEDKLMMEKEVMGLYVSGHPLDRYQHLIKYLTTGSTADLKEKGSDYLKYQYEDGKKITMAGILTKRTLKTTRNKDIMAFAQLEDMLGTVELILFPKTFDRFGPMCNTDERLIIDGRLSIKEDEEVKVIVESVKLLDLESDDLRLFLRFPDLGEDAQREKVEKMLLQFPGKHPVIFYDCKRRRSFQFQKMQGVELNDELLSALKDLFNDSDIKIK